MSLAFWNCGDCHEPKADAVHAEEAPTPALKELTGDSAAPSSVKEPAATTTTISSNKSIMSKQSVGAAGSPRSVANGGNKEADKQYVDEVLKEAQETKEQLDKVNAQLAMLESQQRPGKINLEEATAILTMLSQDTEDEMNFPIKSLMDFDDEEGRNNVLQPDGIALYKTTDMEVQEIGKHVKKSKTQVTWKFQEFDGLGPEQSTPHIVTLTYSKFSGRVEIHMDATMVFNSKML